MSPLLKGVARMPQVDIGGCLSYAVDRFKSNIAFHLLAMVVVAVVGACSLGLISGALMVGYIRALKKQDQGGTVEVGDLFSAMDTFVPTFILLLVMVLDHSIRWSCDHADLLCGHLSCRGG